REMPGIAASRFAKGWALNEVSKPGKHIDIFRPSYLTYKYQYVTKHIITRIEHFPASTRKYA
ncbi:MAG: hypothetical protein WBO88_13020, partial [Candidatus Dechloromonas phosphoritropha]